jgi:hypothetical protein
MKLFAVFFALSAWGLAAASAQGFEFLTGQYQCIENCTGPQLAYVTQNGTDLNLLNEAGQPSRAWIDYPGHLWAERWNEGAIFSPDRLSIQFDDGTVWHRFVPLPMAPNLNRRG